MKFLEDAGRIPLLTAEEEILLGRRVQNREKLLVDNPTGPYSRDEQKVLKSGQRAEQRFITANMRLVANVVRKAPKCLRSMDIQDLLQEGCLGLIIATKRFDPERGYKFSTYAYWWIRQAITRSIAEKDRTIRLPVNASDSVIKLNKWISTQKTHPSISQCAEYLGVSEDTIRLYMTSNLDVRSLDMKVGGNDSETSNLSDFIPDPNVDLLGDLGESMEDQVQWVKDHLDILPENHRRVIEMRLEGKMGRGEIAKVIGTHPSNVNEIERKAIRRFQVALEAC
jgi:RNA polymerase sigma factor (sigma-70 family)